MNNFNPPCCPAAARSGTGVMGAHRVMQEKRDSSCARVKAPFPVNTALAMAYVPFQESEEVYSCDRALARGTLFPCLDKPFLKGCCK